MLKVIDLHKSYHSKKGVTFKALKGLDLSFDNTGFVVILGKSGSGKSTLLNILGGLDKFDSGDIIIENKSTKDFKANLWDAYRNTYVGFVFQEFYLIEEYTIGKNISLALELQGYTVQDIEKKVEEILTKVDLAGYANRMPNELSGGQKQRIAIARALIKDPQIILADEPTGNLDSETGKVILNILKGLSKEKLIILVTHDRDFALEYGDRIIELKDGVVISDCIRQEQNNLQEINFSNSKGIKSLLYVPKGKQLSNQQISYLNDLLLNNTRDFYVSVETNNLFSITTNNLDIHNVNDKFKLKTVSFPFNNAFKLAVNNFKTRRLKLTFMLVLFIIALMFVGVASNFSFYNSANAANLTFDRLNINTIPLNKVTKYCQESGRSIHCSTKTANTADSDIRVLSQTYKSIAFYPTIYTEYRNFNELFPGIKNSNEQLFYKQLVNRFNIIDENTQNLFELRYGTYPSDVQIMITDYLAEVLLHYQAYNDLNTIEDLVGKKLRNDLTISGIVKTKYENYAYLKSTTKVEDISKSDFFEVANSNFFQFYMSNKTYEDYFLQVELIHVDTNIIDGNGIVLTSDIPRENYRLVAGGYPQNDNEMALTLFMIKNYIMSKERKEISDEEALAYLNKEIVLGLSPSYENRYFEKTYKLVGIIEEPKKQVQVNALFTKSEFLYLAMISSYGTRQYQGVTAILGNNQQENVKFITALEKLGYNHLTEVSDLLNYLADITKELKNLFYIIGIVFVLFTTILIFTFISTSISDKQKQIGTLRAMGARGSDILKIYMVEGLIIALISGLIANIITIFVVRLLNYSLVNSLGIPLVLLYTNFLSILLTIILAIIIVFTSSYLPLKRIALMKPINAIKN